LDRTYSDLARLGSFDERFAYLKLSGSVGVPTFGSERYLNQRFYTSGEWRQIRDFVIARDEGCDLASTGHEIFDRVIIHHMNPMRQSDLTEFNEAVLNPEYLITTTHRTHNAIHYGDETLLARPLVQRALNDTSPWRQ